ncbi:hypothetical protein NBRGN_015_00370 [Nocardia brasiliensis NBRC 14402]|nr:hypothetical protein NBRGN_015_00370 [Nocardia brasiliensis NBRC 14402]
MRRSSSWLGAAVGGFAKAALLAAAAVILPALSVAPAVVSALLGSAWSWRNPWSWVGC